MKDYSDETIVMINSILQGAQEADFITSYKLNKTSNDLYYFEFDIDCPID